MTGIVRRGWCPSLYEPMEAGDGLLVRVKPPAGLLTFDATHRLAEAATAFGNGAIALTNRGNLQLRGLQTSTLTDCAAAMVAAGLAELDPERERRRAVIVSPLADADDHSLAHAIEAILCDDPDLAGLPGKFFVAVEVAGTSADITIIGRPSLGYSIRLASALLAAHVAASDMVVVLRRLARLAAIRSQRMRSLLAQEGSAALFAAAGLVASPAAPLPTPTWFGQLGASAFGIGMPFGSTDATTLCALADLARQFGDGCLRLTPQRSLVIAGVGDSNALQLRHAAERLGLIVDPDDRRRGITACVGRPACISALADVRADAFTLLDRPLPGHVHISGCAKGCAHPLPASITLVATGAGYRLVRDGKASDRPERGGLTVAECAAILHQ